MNETFVCRYCGKVCLNTNSLKNHERLCKSNPNRQVQRVVGWPKGKPRTGKTTRGLIYVTNGYENKMIQPESLGEFISTHPEWKRGHFQICTKPNLGVASTPERENERRIRISETMKKNPNSGGRRQGSGRGKKGWYKGIYCDSSWELAYLIYCLDHDIDVKRCEERREYIYEGQKHTYIPDFVIGDKIIEIKGYRSKQWDEKCKQNPDVIVLYEDDMKPYLDYAISKYGKDYINLYE